LYDNDTETLGDIAHGSEDDIADRCSENALLLKTARNMVSIAFS
jgi:hypothetical protein